jgi:hypothetical protein
MLQMPSNSTAIHTHASRLQGSEFLSILFADLKPKLCSMKRILVLENFISIFYEMLPLAKPKAGVVAP